MPELKGSLKNIVYRNDDNDYSIIKIVTEEDTIETITGYFQKLSEGVTYTFFGNYTTHQKFGKQFKAESYQKQEIQHEDGIISYLSSHLFTGIGPKTAEKIVALLGVDAVDKIIDDPSVLRPIGLSAVRMKKLQQELIKERHHEIMLVKLYHYGFTSKMAMKLIAAYGLQTLEKIEANPYQMITDIDQIGFLKADLIAKTLGIEDEDPRRVEAAIEFTFESRGYQKGDTYLTQEQIELYLESHLRVHVDIQPHIEKLIFEGKIKEINGMFSLSPSYFSEYYIAEKLYALSQSLRNQDDVFDVVDLIEKTKHMTYTKVQKEAIATALVSKVSIITGGPGTGKTTIIDGIVSAYLQLNNLKKTDYEVATKIGLMAPTGRAAKRMRDILELPAKTIHSALGYGYDGSFEYSKMMPMPFELIIVDEASMIDIFLGHRLMDAISEHAQVVIVGDVDQLPSVGPGQFLEDLIDSRKTAVTYLTQIHRQAATSQIVKLSQKVNQRILIEEDLKTEDDVFMYQCYPNQIMQTLIKQIKGALDKGYDLYKDIQVLVPVYKGDLGIDQVNIRLQEEFNPKTSLCMRYGDKSFYEGDKVIQLVNEPKQGIMNGDVGIVKKVHKNDENQYTLTVIFDDQEVVYNKDDIDQLNLAYAISVHKAQGSEYDIVMMPLVKSYMHMFKKELIYTAMTRAKSHLLLLGDMKLLMYAANHVTEKRQTLLKQFLNQDVSKEEKTLSPYDFM